MGVDVVVVGKGVFVVVDDDVDGGRVLWVKGEFLVGVVLKGLGL